MIGNQKGDIIIFSFVSNNKFPIDLQIKSFRKYIKEKYVFYIVNDADYDADRKEICEIAIKNKTKYIIVPSSIHKYNNPSESLADTLNWILHNKTDNRKINIFIHGDIFPVCHLSIIELLGHNSIASTIDSKSVGNHRIDYLCPVLTIINKQLKNKSDLFFDCCNGDNMICINDNNNVLKIAADTGGKSYYYIKNNPDVNIKIIPTYETKLINNFNRFNMTTNLKNRFNEYNYFEKKLAKQYKINTGWFTSDGFYHYLAGSQWNIDIINNFNHKNYDIRHPDDNIRRINAANLIKKWYDIQKKKRKNNGIVHRNKLFSEILLPELENCLE